MKRSTGVRHLGQIAESCSALNERLEAFDSPLRIRGLWAFGEVLLPDEEWPATQEFVSAACQVAGMQVDVAWLTRPPEVVWIEDLAGWTKKPVVTLWRPASTPVWNHYVERPLLLWDDAGVRTSHLDILESGRGLELLRPPAPSDGELRSRMELERDTSLASLRSAISDYEDHRWGRGNSTRYADAVWEAGTGLLDVVDALASPPA